MAPEALTADRLHRDIKGLITRGHFAPGLPLNVQAMADEFGTSISPVRDALNRLVGERLVEMQGGGGFAIPAITPRNTHDLYALHADLVRAAIKNAESFDKMIGPPSELVEGIADARSIALVTAEFFTLVAGCSGNLEHFDAITGAGDRLAVRRLHEGGTTRLGLELAMLWNVTKSGNKSTIRSAMWQYHRRRLSRVHEISIAASQLDRSQESAEIL
jgi:DNA-binding transcriptional regulator YhcF (GntR family)